MLPLKQHNVLMELYRHKCRDKKWFVGTRWCNVTTLRGLYTAGYIESDYVVNNVPARFKLSDKGYKYGREHDTKDKRLP